MNVQSIGPKIAAALVAFQAEAPKVHKGKTATVPTKNGGSYRYAYADLVDVTEAAKPLLDKHRLAFVATPRQTERGYELAGLLVHESGEYVEGAVPISGATEQAMGSSITYGRRYLLGCLTGIVTDEDEDGAAATQADHRDTPDMRQQAAQRYVGGIAQCTDPVVLENVRQQAEAEGLLDVNVTTPAGNRVILAEAFGRRQQQLAQAVAS